MGGAGSRTETCDQPNRANLLPIKSLALFPTLVIIPTGPIDEHEMILWPIF